MGFVERVRESVGMGPDKKFAYYYVYVSISRPDCCPELIPWRKNSVFYYPLVLYSYGSKVVGRWHPENVEREMMFDRSEAVLFVDSGGFQAAQGYHIDQLEVLGYQLRWAHAGPILDYPPFGDDPSSLPRVWERNLERTKANVEIVLKYYDRLVEETGNRDFMLYAVLHGVSPRQLEKWWQTIVDPLLETGITGAVAIGLVKMDAVTNGSVFAYWLSFIKQYGAKILHVFGVGGSSKISSLMYLSRYFDLLTTDSSFASTFARYARISLPSKPSVNIRGTRKLKQLPSYCPCPACQWYKRHRGYYPFEYNSSMDMLTHTALELHNFFWIVSNLAYLDWKLRVEGPSVLEGEYNVRMDILHDTMDKGYEWFWNKHCGMIPKYYRAVAGGCPSATHSFF